MAFWSGKIIHNLAYRREKTHHIQDNLPSPSRRSTVSPLQVVSPGPKKKGTSTVPTIITTAVLRNEPSTNTSL